MAKTRMVLLANIPSMNELPASERWLLKDHCLETLSWIAPWLDSYVSYRAVPPPPAMHADVMRFGYYNWRVTNHVYNDTPPPASKLWSIVAPVPHPVRPKVVDVEEIYDTKASGSLERPLLHLLCFVPFIPTEDFLGSRLDAWGTSIIRWLQIVKYPEGVSREEGEKWYLETHAREVMQQPGLIRYFSYRTIDFPGQPAYPWHRVSELWYADFNSWKKANIDSPPAYTQPAWATYHEYPFAEPFKDFASSFILERPTNDFLRDYRGYYIAP
jgi:hypothetical protein